MITIARVKVRCLSRNQRDALACLADGRSTASCHIQRKVQHPDSTTTRRMLKGLERAGLVAGISSHRGGRVYWWQITDAGRAEIGTV